MVAQASDGTGEASGHDAAPSVDAAELAKFAAMAEGWWDPHGKLAPLHKLNPTRIAFVRDRIASTAREPPSR